MLIEKIRPYAKFAVAIIGAALTTLAGFLPDQIGPILAATSAFLTAVFVFAVPNTPALEAPLTADQVSRNA